MKRRHASQCWGGGSTIKTDRVSRHLQSHQKFSNGFLKSKAQTELGVVFDSLIEAVRDGIVTFELSDLRRCIFT